MLRKNKKQIATEQEKTILYRDGDLAGKGRDVGSLIFSYNNAAKYFEKNMAKEETKRTKRWRNFCFVSWAMSVSLTIAIASLAPLKTVVPYVLRVDTSSGYVDVVKPASESSESYDVKEDKRNLTAYILARESYNWASHPANYHVVQVMSYGNVFNEYKRFQLSSKGYTAAMGKNQQFRVAINGFIPMKEATALGLSSNKDIKTWQVRFTKTLLDDNNQPVIGAEPTYWVSVVSFDYHNKSATEGDDNINPREWGALAYERSQEINKG